VECGGCFGLLEAEFFLQQPSSFNRRQIFCTRSNLHLVERVFVCWPCYVLAGKELYSGGRSLDCWPSFI
jgi:hypothetical protein